MLRVTAVFLLQLPVFMGDAADGDCLLRKSAGVRVDGDVVIGGFFSLYTFCYFTGTTDIQPTKDFFVFQLMPNSYQNVLAFVFAIEEINRNPHLLPNVSLGYEFYNVLHSQWRVLESFLILHTGQDEIPNYTCKRESRSVAVLMGTSWATAAQYGTVMELYRFPQLTFGSFDPMLNDNGQFPSLYQVAPKDTKLALAMVSLLLYFSWTWVGLVSTEANHHEETPGFKSFIQTATPSKYPEDHFLALYWFRNFRCSLSDSDCTLKNCAPNASLALLPVNYFDMTMSDESYNVYSAVYAVAHALHEMLLQHVQMQSVENQEAMVFSPWQLHPVLKNIQFNNPAGDQVNLDDKKKLDAEYDILNFWNVPEGLRFWMKIGKFSSHVSHGQQLTLSEDMIEWATGILETPRSVCSDSCNPGFRKTPQEGKAACCFDCIPCPESEITNDTDMEQCVKCPDHQYSNTQRSHCLQKERTFLAYEDPLGKALAGTALSFAILTAAVLGLFVKHRDTPIVKANNRGLSYILLISLISCFLCALLFIGRPNTATCILQQTTFGVVFTVAVSTILAKTITVVLAFKATAPGRRMRQLLVSGAPNSIIPICSLIQLTLCGLWMGISPPFIDTDAHSEHGHIIIVCNKGSLTAFYCVLGALSEQTVSVSRVTHEDGKLQEEDSSHTEHPRTVRRAPQRAKMDMFRLRAILFLLQLPVLLANEADEHCLVSKGAAGHKDGDVVIGGFFFLYGCVFLTGITDLEPSKDFQILQLQANSYQNALALIFAIEEINRNPQLLPNISVGYEFYNVIFSHWRVLESVFILHAGQDEIPNYTCGRDSRSVALLTGASWAASAQIGPLLELYRFPQLTFGSFDPTLSDSGQFPSLYQMAAKDTALALAMVSLMLHFSWNWAGLIVTEGQKGLRFAEDLRAEMDRGRLCVANFHCSLSDSDCTLRNCPPNASLAWLSRNRFDTAMSAGSYNVYNAVYAVAHALHTMLYEHVQLPSMENPSTMMIPSRWQLHPFLKNTHFRNPVGEHVHLDEKNRLDAKYDILNFWNFPEGLRLKVKVGEFSPHVPRSQQLLLSEDVMEWAIGISETPRSVCSESCHPGFRKAPQEGKAACCFDCIPCPEDEIANATDMEQCVKCPDHQYANAQRNRCLQKSASCLAYADPLGTALAAAALGLTVLAAAVLLLFVRHRDTPVIKANNRALSYTLLVSLSFCFLCSLLFIGCPTTATCVLQQSTFGTAFTVAVSTVLAKTVTVVLAFKVTAPGRRTRKLLMSGAPNYIIPICTLIQLTLCGIWMGTNPPFIDTDAHSEHGHIIIVCNKGSLTAFYCVLGYLGSLALGSFTVAFLARNLPDTFNEAKYLTFSMLVFCSVWVTFLPVYHSTRGKAMVAMEVFSILASSAGLLGCIFGPKCYIVLLRPDRNSPQLLVCTLASEDCLSRRSTSMRQDGDVVIGGIFALYYCFYLTGTVDLQPSKDAFGLQLLDNNYQNFLAFIFAIEEINRDSHILPNISLGYEFHNFLHSHWRTLESFFILYTGQDETPNYTCKRESNPIAVITGTSQIGPLVELYKFPQVRVARVESDDSRSLLLLHSKA
ncbi:uncharacterized protein ACOB6Z_012483 [Ctenodactylus gundi]